MTTKNSNSVTCNHCLLKFNKNTAIAEKDGDDELYFCCAGCRSVYHVIKDGGFDKFYEKRRGFKPGPPEQIRVDGEIFSEDIKKIDEGYEIDISVSNIRCAACIWLIENYLGKLPGVNYVRANYATHQIRVRWDNKSNLNKILNVIVSIGYIPIPVSVASGDAYVEKEKKAHFYRLGAGAFFTMQVMIYSVALYAGYFEGIEENLKIIFKIIAMILTLPVILYSGLPFLKNSINSIKYRVLNMDVLVVLGAYSAFLYSIYQIFAGGEIYFDTTCMIITLILLGRFIELEAKTRASKEISMLFNLQPRQAKLLKNFNIEEYKKGTCIPLIIKSSSIKSGDILEVLPGENIPADGKIIYGKTDINESMLTGESLPVFKQTGDEVISGTQNLSGNIIIKSTCDNKNSTFSKISEAIKQAQEEKLQTQKIADRVTEYFVPAIILTAFLTFIFWYFSGAGITKSIMNAISVLVVACPCAMGLATPLGILVASTTAFKNGILLKNGKILEDIHLVKEVFFDKTGTITEGAPSIHGIKTFSPDTNVLKIAASLERFSNHLIAKTIVKNHKEDFYKATDIKEIPGCGVIAEINGIKAGVGNKKIFNELNLQNTSIKEYEQNGLTNVYVIYNGVVVGVITLKDNLRDSFEEIYNYLTKKQIRISVLTGDTFKSASNTLEKFKNITIYAELSPFDKRDILKKRLKDSYPLMLGDGINDAPALKNAFIGIAMGKGSEIALESADAVLMNSDLKLLKSFFMIADKTRRVIKSNFFWAFSYNFVVVPLAVTGRLHPVFSAILMSFSSLLVVFNSLRIKTSSRNI